MPQLRLIHCLEGYNVTMHDDDTFTLTPIAWVADAGISKGEARFDGPTPTVMVNELTTTPATLEEAAANGRRAFLDTAPLVQRMQKGDANALREALRLNPIFWRFDFFQEMAGRLMTAGASFTPKMGRPEGIGRTADGRSLAKGALVMLVELAARAEGRLEAAFDRIATYARCSREHIRTTFFRERKRIASDPRCKPMLFPTGPNIRVGYGDYEKIIGRAIVALKPFQHTNHQGVVARYTPGLVSHVNLSDLAQLPRRAFRLATRREIRVHWHAGA